MQFLADAAGEVVRLPRQAIAAVSAVTRRRCRHSATAMRSTSASSMHPTGDKRRLQVEEQVIEIVGALVIEQQSSAQQAVARGVPACRHLAVFGRGSRALEGIGAVCGKSLLGGAHDYISLLKVMLPGEVPERRHRTTSPAGKGGLVRPMRVSCSLEPARRIRHLASRSSRARFGSNLRRGATRRRPRFCLTDCAWGFGRVPQYPGILPPCRHGRHALATTGPYTNAHD